MTAVVVEWAAQVEGRRRNWGPLHLPVSLGWFSWAFARSGFSERTLRFLGIRLLGRSIMQKHNAFKDSWISQCTVLRSSPTPPSEPVCDKYSILLVPDRKRSTSRLYLSSLQLKWCWDLQKPASFIMVTIILGPDSGKPMEKIQWKLETRWSSTLITCKLLMPAVWLLPHLRLSVLKKISFMADSNPEIHKERDSEESRSNLARLVVESHHTTCV